MNSMAALLFAFVALSSAQTPPTPDAEPPVEEKATHTMRLAQLDLRVSGDTDILLAYVDLGLGADFGVLPIAEGVLTVGGEVNAGACGTVCLFLGAVTGYRWSNFNLAPSARVTYHHSLPLKVATDKLDFYALALAGPVFTSMSVSAPDNSFNVTGSDVGLGVGVGAGVNYFFADRLFAGAEGRLRYARGRYTTTVNAGQYTFTDAQDSWDLSGFNVVFFVGTRL